MNRFISTSTILSFLFIGFTCFGCGELDSDPPCTSNYEKKCSNGDVYWYDSCGDRGDKYDDCGSGGCSNGECLSDADCTPTSNYEKKCSNGDVYWYDSCGDRGDKYDDCGSGGCSNGECLSDADCTPTSKHEKKCSNGDVYWYDSCGDREDKYDDCGSGETCSGGKCVSDGGNGLAPDSYEDDDSESSATSLTITTSAGSQDHTVYPSGDRDYFKFYADPGYVYTFYTSGSTDIGCVMHDSSGHWADIGSDEGDGLNFRIERAFADSGYYSTSNLYYLNIGVPTGGQTPTGSYTLHYYRESFTDDDEYEDNDYSGQDAALMTAGNYDSLECKDNDFYKVLVDPDHTLRVTINFSIPGPYGGTGNLELDLKSSAGQILDSSQGTEDSEMVEAYVTTADYYRIYVWGHYATNSYNMTISILDGDQTSSCTPNCSGKECGDDGCGGSCGSCDSGETCSNGVCDSCSVHTDFGCYSEHVYWKDSCGNWEEEKEHCDYGCSESFCNPPPCDINITYPTSGSSFDIGAGIVIRWSKSDGCGSDFKIEAYQGNAKICTITPEISNDDGQQLWLVGSCCGNTSDEYRIKITDLASGEYDYSEDFSINGESECGNYNGFPNKWTSWTIGEVVDVSCNLNNGSDVSVDLYFDGSYLCRIYDSAQPLRVYNWTVTDCGLGYGFGNLFQIKVTSSCDSSCYAYSDEFIITD